MKKKLSTLIVLTLVSVLLFALPAMADTKPAASNMPDQNMSGHSPSEASHGDARSPEVIVAKDGKFQVIVEADPEKPGPNKPVNIMITVKNEATGQPVLDASVNVEMMLMAKSAHGDMSGTNMDSSTTLKGQAKLEHGTRNVRHYPHPNETRGMDPRHSYQFADSWGNHRERAP